MQHLQPWPPALASHSFSTSCLTVCPEAGCRPARREQAETARPPQGPPGPCQPFTSGPLPAQASLGPRVRPSCSLDSAPAHHASFHSGGHNPVPSSLARPGHLCQWPVPSLWPCPPRSPCSSQNKPRWWSLQAPLPQFPPFHTELGPPKPGALLHRHLSSCYSAPSCTPRKPPGPPLPTSLDS